MKKMAIRKIKKALLEQRKELAGKMMDLEVDTDGDEVDLLQARQILTVNAQLSARDRNRLKMIDAALVRIEKEEFGICLECGENVSDARLIANPQVEHCIDCAETLERLAKQKKR